jgi:phage-related protein
MNNANGGNVIYHFLGDTKELEQKVNGLKGIIGKGAKLGGALMGAVATGSAIAGKALVDVSKQAIDAYADIEQSIGGVETLFGESADKVIENARRAYKTAGVDANTYMQGVNSFAASLLQSVEGNTEKAMETADMAFQDMSDNANKFGSDMESITRAYQSFARGQFTLLDNLKLGYGGTRGEMERLLADAEAISGIHYDINNLNDMYQAIHVIQTQMGITGTTAKEAMSTISGSVNSAKMAIRNLISGEGSVDDVIETVTQAGTNLANAFVKIAPRIADALVGVINGLLPLLPGLLQTILPVLVNATVSLMQGLAQALPGIIKTLAPMLPDIIEAVLQGLVEISYALAEAMPEIVPAIIEALVDSIVALCENVDTLLEASVALIGGLVQGISIALPKLVQQAPRIIGALVQGLLQAIGLGELGKTGRQMIEGLWNGIVGAKNWIVNKVKGLAKSILDGMKNALGIHSPSTEFAFLGKMSVLGYTDQLEDMKGDLNEAIQSTFSLSPELSNSSSLHYIPNVIVNNQMNMTTDPLGQVVGNIKTFANGAKNDYNYGMGW